MSNLYKLLFTSIANENVDDVELYEILTQSTANNECNRITGLLVCRDGVFLQAMEGEKELVLKTYERISQDTRHRELTIVFEEEVSERQFVDFKLCFDTNFERVIRQTGKYVNYKELKAQLADVDNPCPSLKKLRSMVA